MEGVGGSRSHLNVLLGPTDRVSRAIADSDVDKIFERVSRKIAAEFLRRSSFAIPTDTIRPIPWLESVCYEFVSEIIEAEETDVFERRIAKYGRGRRGPKGNIFQLAILGIFVEGPRAKLSPQARARIGKRLWYAYRHYVPLCFLSGFLFQVSNRDFLDRVNTGAVQPGFEQWLIRRRASLGNRAFEDLPYPAEIERAVKKRRRKRKTFLE